MDKRILKIVVLIVTLIVIVALILLICIKGLSLGPIDIVSIVGITNKRDEVNASKQNLEIIEGQYAINAKKLETAKKEFKEEKDAYELISDDTIAAINDATKEEEYFIEYLWITLGNYAAKHDLSLAVIEPGGNISRSTTKEEEIASNDPTSVSTGTGINGNSESVTSKTSAASTGSPTSGVRTNANSSEEEVTSDTDSLSSSASALTVQVKGSYIDLADFVFEVENDKSLRFRLDNISMKSAGGTQVITSFNVKDFTVLKSLQQ